MSINSFKARSPHGASSFNFQYPIFSLRSSSSCLLLLPHLPMTVIFPSTSPSKHVLESSSYAGRDQSSLPSVFFTVRSILFSLTLCNTSSFLTRSVLLIFSIPTITQHNVRTVVNNLKFINHKSNNRG